MCSRVEAPLALLAALLAGALGCAGEPPEVPLEAVAAEAVDDSVPGLARGRVHVVLGEERPLSNFPHPPHAGFECTRCHTAVPGHATHRAVGCRDCHEPVGAAAGVAGTATSGDCNSCHHDPAPAYGCAHCHETRAAPPDRPVEVLARFSTAPESRTRRLPFRHSVHTGVACARCHGDRADAPPASACASCHESHHTVAASCAGCHAAPAPGVHGIEAHLGCAGGGCHQDAAVNALRLVRAVCVACHDKQALHEPGRECSTCHLVRPTVAGRGAEGVE